MRRSTEKQAKFENEVQTGPSAKKSRTDKKITNIATLDNDTIVEVFKYLNYCRLAKTGLVSKRFSNLISNHRHKLALLYVKSIGMSEEDNSGSTGIEIFDKTLSPAEYNEWVIRNGYSKQIPLETEIAGMQSTEYSGTVYYLFAGVDYDYKDPKSLYNFVFYSHVELSHENWPVFQHYFRLITDPYIYIRSMGLPRQSDALNLLASAINPNYGRLQCRILDVSLKDNMQDRLSWIKGHVRCDLVYIEGVCYLPSKHDEMFLDLFMTGANCTSKIELNFYEPCKLIDCFVQKFMDLKSSDEDKVVGFIECHPNWNVNIDSLKRVHADFVVEGNVNETSRSSNLVFEFVNNDIGKKLRLAISFGYRTTEFTLKVANL